jgi:undecaprenyl diphosphate synthase
MTAEPRAVPQHVAIIMDGNGRWAKSRGLPRVAGHKRGADAVRRAVKIAGELGVRYLTLFGFSSENWKRPLDEITDLMALLRNYLRSELAELHAQGVRVRVIGDRARLAPDIVTLIEQAERTTEANTKLDFVIALSYGARAEIARAARALAHAAKAGEIDPETIGEADIAKYLYTSDIPDPDLLVRTSGEKRISNFLLWQSAYTEFVFLDVLWPDFDRAHFEAAIAEFGQRDRRYGAIVG